MPPHATPGIAKHRVPPNRLMCRRHWYMVPQNLRDAIWVTYRPGQEITKDVSPEYLVAAGRAIDAVTDNESRTPQ
jgi:hypothetical protein